jgi:serine-type D-Ala-D-Ala carboxypeptidase/endopeptidase (penicillin-binding protein 4)
VRPAARLLALLVVAIACLALVATATAAPSKVRLERALSSSGVPAAAQGAIVVDLRDGKVVYARNGTQPFRPASNEKLPVSVAALHRLGPGFRFTTRVLGSGRRQGAVWRGNLVLEGSGDPTLRSADLRALARQVRARGITRVEGRVIADATRFDGRRTASGWRAGFYKRYSAPLSALVVDYGILDGRMSDRPEVTAGVLFRRALAAQGVRVTGPDGAGRARRGAVPLAHVRSEPLAEIVERVNRDSDNFAAEMLMKELWAQTGKTGTTQGGARVVRSVLGELGVPLAGVRIVDGSGLSSENRLTARALASLLVAARKQRGIHRPFSQSLAVAGRSGTLAGRLRGTPAQGAVRAKTGTTRQASSLSGYVHGRYAFAILMNGEPVPHWSARSGQDRFVTVLAASVAQ